MKKYQTILFDLDGTIADSEPGIRDCISVALDRYGIAYDEKILHAMVGPPFRVSMREFFGVDGDIVNDMINIYRAKYEIDGWRNGKLFDGVEELIRNLKAEGFTLAVATSKPLKFAVLMIREYGLERYFDFIGGAESDSTRDAKTEVIDYVLENLKITDKSSAVIIGDRLYDTEGAKLSGIDSIGILWGYGTREELETHGATYILEKPEDVFNFLTQEV